jgi:hypothetical protein
MNMFAGTMNPQSILRNMRHRSNNTSNAVQQCLASAATAPGSNSSGSNSSGSNRAATNRAAAA